MPFICMLFEACNQLSTSVAEAHKMTVMTLEDHSSKGLVPSPVPRPQNQTQVSSHCLPISTSSCLASSDSSDSPSSVSSFSSVFELGLLVYAGSLLSFACTIRHISVGALLCL